MKRLLVGAAIVGIAVCWNLACSYRDAHGATARAADAERVALLVRREHRQERTIRSSRSTLRFFERHAQLLYSAPAATRHRAWRVVAFHQARIGWTTRELAETRGLLIVLRRPRIPHRAEWLCIQRGETPPPFPAWRTRSGNGYYGGLQMDLGFQRSHGLDLYLSKGTADHWTADEQMTVAERAHDGIRTDRRKDGRVYFWRDRPRGYRPWPNTARACGLL